MVSRVISVLTTAIVAIIALFASSAFGVKCTECINRQNCEVVDCPSDYCGIVFGQNKSVVVQACGDTEKCSSVNDLAGLLKRESAYWSHDEKVLFSIVLAEVMPRAYNLLTQAGLKFYVDDLSYYNCALCERDNCNAAQQAQNGTK